MPSPAAPADSTAAVTIALISSALSCVGQVDREDLGLGLLLVGELLPVTGRECLGGLATLLGLRPEHGDDVLVGQLLGLLAGHLGVGDGGERHAQRRRTQGVASLHRGDEIGVELVLEG